MKKAVIIMSLLVGIALIFSYFGLKAHSQGEDNSPLTVPTSFFTDVRQKLDKIAAQNEKLQIGAIQQKLDQILSNQEQIKQELEVIKIRATRN